MKKPLALAAGLAFAAALGFVACDDPIADDPEDRGGWDGNSGNYNGNLGSFGTVQGVGGVPPWALEATGPGTLTNASMYGVQWVGSQTTTPCSTATPGIVTVRFLSSSGTAGAAIGPDVEVERTGGARARLAMGEEIVFPGRVVDGYANGVDVMFRTRRVDTLEYRNAPGYEWPVFSLELCENPASGPPPVMPVWKHMGFVSWAPFVRLPELPGETFQFRDDLVQAITTIPRVEYVDNPNVPAVVARQSGALLFKFAFFSGTPIALRRESALDLRTSAGLPLSNPEFQMRGALALGNASWVTLEPGEDPGQHRFPAFFTRDGTEVALFSLGRGGGTAPTEIHLPTAWGGGVVSLLQLTDAERTPDAADSLDSVQAIMDVTSLPAGQRMAAEPSHLASGRSNFRMARFMNSNNNRKVWYHAKWRENVMAARVGIISGRVNGQAQLEAFMTDPFGPARAIVAAQSPLTPGVDGFEQLTNVEPAPPDAPVNHPDPPIDAPTDAAVIDAPVIDAPVIDAPADAMIDAAVIDAPADAMADAPVDAAVVDAPVDAMPDAPVDAPPIDAPIIPDAGPDAPPVDAPMMPDAGPDAPPIDAPMMPDAGIDGMIIDAPFMPPDAGADAAAAIDAPVDAPIDAEVDAEVDAAIDAPDIDAPDIDAAVDAPDIDAPDIDAPVDAEVDAPVDAEIDAPDAPVDAEVDAPLDAPEVDAPEDAPDTDAESPPDDGGGPG